ncbi:response regulator [Phenylobacterium sp.]|uniref:response regulator n=1 Tax=Phenylobacterium sp. TaxID=1871053 RepID=UPI00273404FA|nr:response regulator [Phenylobacterium sp.]MDP3659161.1 response regulator [Phenylobacterium sp.]
MKSPRVILVEDESLVALMMQDLLTDLGCEVVASFGSLNPALIWLEQQETPPDGALLDVNLGGELVFPLAAALAAKRVPFAFATGYGAVGDVRFERAPLLHKPVDIGKLAPIIDLFTEQA